MSNFISKSKDVNHKCFSRKWRPYTKDMSVCAQFWKKQCHLTKSNIYENRAWEILKKYQGWKRQYFFGRRIFDFFHEQKGIAIEIDGASHCKNCDRVRDRYLHKKYGILTARFFNSFKPQEIEDFIGRTCLRFLQDYQLIKVRNFRTKILKALSQKEKKGKKKKGFQSTIENKTFVSKRKNKINLHRIISRFQPVREIRTDKNCHKKKKDLSTKTIRIRDGIRIEITRFV